MERRGDNPGVSLSSYRTFGSEMAVEFRCCDCQAHFEVPLETVIARLTERGVGGPETGVREVARFVERPCASCGGRRFTSRPAFPPARHTPGRQT